MFDLVLLMAAVAFFAASIHYVFVCDLTPLLGGYMTRVFNGQHTLLSPVLRGNKPDDPQIVLTEPGIGYRVAEA